MNQGATRMGTTETTSIDKGSTYELPQRNSGVFKNALGRQATVVVIDDDSDIRVLLRKCLEIEGIRVFEAESINELKSIVSKRFIDAVLADVYLDGENGLDVTMYLASEAPFTKVFIMTAQDTVSLAVDAMEKGATTFFPKSMGPVKIADSLKEHMRVSLELPHSQTERIGNVQLIGRSSKMQTVLQQIQQMKDVDSTVLILGESGTGKELVARALHEGSLRQKGGFEAINCGAIPETLLESELFGHRKGAFTDAKSDRKGLFEICSEGTLLLDEIGDMPLSLQVKLLRVLQEREVRPLGSGTTVKINTRVIASTHKNLEEEVRQGRFRQDLYFRLSVLQVSVPPLRERREDIPLLVNHFIQIFNQRFGKQVREPSHEVMARLKAAPWVGNIRELQNAIERAVVLSQDNIFHLENVFCDRDVPEEGQGGVYDLENLPLSHAEAKERFERQYLEKLLTKSHGNISHAARLAGKHRVEIYRLLGKYQIDHSKYKSQ